MPEQQAGAACLAIAILTVTPDGHAGKTTEAARNVRYLQAGSYFHDNDHRVYADTPWLLGFECHQPEGTIDWFSIFENSFGLFSQCLYMGKNHPWDKDPGFRAKVAGGIVPGYDGRPQAMSPIDWGDAAGIALDIGDQDGALGLGAAAHSAAEPLIPVGDEF